jgi:hypothetical protein
MHNLCSHNKRRSQKWSNKDQNHRKKQRSETNKTRFSQPKQIQDKKILISKKRLEVQHEVLDFFMPKNNLIILVLYCDLWKNRHIRCV